MQIYTPATAGALRQGEILSDVVQPRPTLESLRENVLNGADLRVDEVRHPLAIVLTQDCDLDWDYKARQPQAKATKRIPAVLFCQVAPAAEVHAGAGGSDIWKRIQQNKDERYQFLQQVPGDQDALGAGLPELALDFKRYFTVQTDELYLRIELEQAKRRCRLLSPYLEQLSDRFFYFQSRIALPADHESEP